MYFVLSDSAESKTFKITKQVFFPFFIKLKTRYLYCFLVKLIGLPCARILRSFIITSIQVIRILYVINFKFCITKKRIENGTKTAENLTFKSYMKNRKNLMNFIN